MSEITRIAIDTSKAVFTLHAVDQAGRAVLQRNLRRQEVVPFFEKQAPAEVALRRFAPLGADAAGAGSQIPPQYASRSKRGKNDRNDAQSARRRRNPT